MGNKLLSAVLLLSSSLWGEGYTHTQALKICQEKGGRLPSYHELLQSSSPLEEGIYWTFNSLPYTSDEFYAISTNKEANSYKGETKLSFICMSDKQPPPLANFVISDLTITETTTQLTWERKKGQTKKERYTFEQAHQYCENLSLDGGNWHLPTLSQLSTLANPLKTAPSTYEIFNDTIFKYYWTSTNSPIPFSNEAYVVGFKIGSIALSPKVNESFVRCVRKAP